MTPAEVYVLAERHLTERQFQAFWLIEFERMSQRQAARMVGIDRSGLRQHLERAYAKLSVLPEMQDWAREHGLGPGAASFEDAQAGASS